MSRIDILINRLDSVAMDLQSVYTKLAQRESLPRIYNSPRRVESPWANASWPEFVESVEKLIPAVRDAPEELKTVVRRVHALADHCETYFPQTRRHVEATRRN